MHTKKELEITKATSELKINDILNEDVGIRSNLQYINDLQALITLKNAAENINGI